MAAPFWVRHSILCRSTPEEPSTSAAGDGRGAAKAAAPSPAKADPNSEPEPQTPETAAPATITVDAEVVPSAPAKEAPDSAKASASATEAPDATAAASAPASGPSTPDVGAPSTSTTADAAAAAAAAEKAAVSTSDAAPSTSTTNTSSTNEPGSSSSIAGSGGDAATATTSTAPTPTPTPASSSTSSGAAAGPGETGGVDLVAHALEDVPAEEEEDMFGSKELIQELADGKSLGSRGELLFVAQFAVLAMIVVPPLTLKGLVDFVATVSITAGAVFILYGLVSLGRNLSPLPLPRKKHSLVMEGIYGYVRHPMYGGLLLGSLGLAILTRNESRLALVAVLWFVLENKVALEEKALGERYPQYDEYKKKVKKFFPYFY